MCLYTNTCTLNKTLTIIIPGNFKLINKNLKRVMLKRSVNYNYRRPYINNCIKSGKQYIRIREFKRDTLRKELNRNSNAEEHSD